MWRKQDDPKAPVTSQEPTPTPPPQAVASTSAAAVSISPASSASQAAAPAGHLTKGLIVKGEITGREDFLVEGEVHGQIRIADGRVTVAPAGRLVAWVEAREIVVRGKVKGDLRASQQVQIGPTGSVIGDIVTPRIAIDEGAELRGNVDTTRAEARNAGRPTSPAVAAASPGKSESRPAPLPPVAQTKEAVPGA